VSITTADGWFAAAKQKARIAKTAAAATIALTPFSLLDVAGAPGAGSLTIGNTAAGLVPTDADAGYPTINAFGGGAKGYLGGANFRNSVAGAAILYDRLFHAGSFSLATLQTFTLAAQPAFTGRLPSGTDFSNLEILLEVNVAIAAAAVTVAIGYTSDTAVAGRTTGASASLSGFTTRRVIAMPLQAGDKSLSKIESLTVGGTVAATGSVNVIVARRLAEFDVRIANGLDSQGWDLIGSPEIFDTSALWLVAQPDSTSSGAPNLNLNILNG
jgi:hypothetical protein